MFPDTRITGALHETGASRSTAWNLTFAFTQALVPVAASFYWLASGDVSDGSGLRASDEHRPTGGGRSQPPAGLRPPSLVSSHCVLGR